MKNKHKEFLEIMKLGTPEPQVKKADCKSVSQSRKEQEELVLQEELERRFNELFESFEED